MTYIPVKRGDSQTLLEIDLLEDGQSCDLTTASSVKIVFSSTKKESATIIQPPTNGEVSYMLSAEDLAVIGFFRLEVEVTFNDGSVMTFPSDEYIMLDVVQDVG